MASASECDQLDVQKVVRLLLKDRYLIDNRGLLWEILDIPYADVKAAEDQYRADLITLYGLFTKNMHTWKSKTSGSLKDLWEILSKNGFKTSAGN
jgi:hypothetical protein